MKVRNWFVCLMVAALLVSLTACGGGSSDSAAMDYEAPQEMANGSLTSDSVAMEESTSVSTENRKLIKTVNIDAETEELDTILAAIEAKISELGGYSENREIHNGSSYSQRRYRSASLTIRIPAEQVDNFVEHVDGVSNIVSSNESVEDITLQYVDTESRVMALETEQERLLTLMEQAQTMADLLEIEARLTEVRYELESVTSQLRTMDNLVSYATVHLYISEVQEYTPVEEETAWQRIAGGFMDSLEGIADGAVELMVWILANSPYLVLYGGVAAVVIHVVRKRKKKQKVNKAPREEKSE